MSFVNDFITGRTVGFDEIDACLSRLKDRWLVSCHALPSGDTGWYRRLSVADRIGLVATAHAIMALRASGSGVPNIQKIVPTLLSRRRADGAWPFVSNLSDVGVVDSTATMVPALYEWQDDPEFRATDLRNLLQGSLDWLEQSALADGGWGIAAGAAYRNYSTAIAIQALCACGRRSSPVVQRAIHRLLSVADPGTGGWHDAERNLSIPTTCEVVRALSAAARDDAKYEAEIAKACHWILKVGRQTRLWEAGPKTACLEEVEVTVDSRLVRIEYGHSPRPVAISALSAGGFAAGPEVVGAVRALLDDIAANRWEKTAGGRTVEPTSWMLYDVTMALVKFRESFPRNTVAVWADNARVVEHRRGQGALVRAAHEHWTKIAVAGGCVLLLWMLVRAEIVPGFGIAMLLFVVATISLNMIANLGTDLLNNRRPKGPSRMT